jgi:hypothetical protein
VFRTIFTSVAGFLLASSDKKVTHITQRFFWRQREDTLVVYIRGNTRVYPSWSRHTWTLQKKTQFQTQFRSRHSIIPPPCWLSCWLSCWMLCCCHVVVIVFVYFVATLPTPQPPPPLARHCRPHHRRSVRRMMPAIRTLTAAPPRWRKLSAGHWNPVHCWTGPSQPVARAAKAALMMVAPTMAAEVGSRTGSVWSSPPRLLITKVLLVLLGNFFLLGQPQ